MATDAIGMGLNMDLDHVAFARLVKFDGFAPRRLAPAEIAQIAGRAGRHMSDGSFGVTDEITELAPETVEAVENHRFDPLRRLYWRNARLDYRSVGGLIAALETRPHVPGLVAARQADDLLALRALAQMSDISLARPASAGGAASLGGLPDPGFPQGDERQPCASLGADLPASGGRRRAACPPTVSRGR